VNAHPATSRGHARGAATRIGTPDAIGRQIREEFF
jgi:hypothetical protein